MTLTVTLDLLTVNVSDLTREQVGVYNDDDIDSGIEPVS